MANIADVTVRSDMSAKPLVDLVILCLMILLVMQSTEKLYNRTRVKHLSGPRSLNQLADGDVKPRIVSGQWPVKVSRCTCIVFVCLAFFRVLSFGWIFLGITGAGIFLWQNVVLVTSCQYQKIQSVCIV